MAITHRKQLEAIKEKQKTLQEKEYKIKDKIIQDLSNYLIDANAIDVDIDVLMGGMLDIIEKAKSGDKITEAWKLSGQKFCQQIRKRNLRKNPSSSKKIQKNKNDDQ